ncbi:isoaspartyl peptidase/L-asparaginase-like [Neodiprion virginianus]|uniref:isoaspartyl peptidase/L-asparaginase-like n=2 Tax=Neodiprion TaxID=270857 RepID=UPI001EE6E5A7|nr:isoaspartyl peptidase/L-asparaginase-like [Neodiprion virginianus]
MPTYKLCNPHCKPLVESLATSICEPAIEMSDLKKKCCIIVHGGCGQCSDTVMCEKLDGCKKAVCRGYKKMMDGGNALDAVEAALWWLECDEFFNCGYGSVLNQLGDVQMDASIMDGNRFEIGSVAAVSDIEHPISLAKFVLENYPNTILVGDGAKKLSRCTDMHWISGGNMVSPKAILALHLSNNCSQDLKYDVEDVQSADLLKSNH